MLKIIQVPDKKLREKSKPIKKLDGKILSLISLMEKTLKQQKDPEGVGLAAPQVGRNLKLFVINHKGVRGVFINPEIIEVKDIKILRNKHHLRSGDQKDIKKESKQETLEGCLSLPNYYSPIERPRHLKLKYQIPAYENGVWKLTQKVEIFKGFIAQILQHEVDHLEGILFVDRLLEQKKPLYKLTKDNEWEEVELV